MQNHNEKNKCIILNGTPRSGKDTFVDICSSLVDLFSKISEQNKYPNMKWKVNNLSSVYRAKRAARELGYDGVKTPKSRKFIAALKKLSIAYCDGPNQEMFNTGVKKLGAPKTITFYHIREPKEIEKFKNMLKANPSIYHGPEDVYTVLITRAKAEGEQSCLADKCVKDYDYDIIISNNGTLSELIEEAKKFLYKMTDGVIQYI